MSGKVKSLEELLYEKSLRESERRRRAEEEEHDTKRPRHDSEQVHVDSFI